MFNSLSIPDFRLLWFGMLFSMAAIQMNIVARAWLAYDISGSGLAIGLVALARGGPRFFIAPFGGVAADRIDKRKLLVLAQIVRIGLALSVALLVTFGLIEIWHLMVVGLFQGISSSFMMPARTAFISDLVEDERLANAIALDSTGRNINRIVAPALGGLFIAVTPALVFYVVAGFYVLATLTMLRLPSSKPAEKSENGVLTDAADGFRYLWGNRGVLALLAMSVAVVLIGMPFRSLLPVFQKDVLEVGPSALGIMYTALGIGAIIASLTVAYASESPHKRFMLVGSGLAFGVFLTLFAISGSYVLALILLAIVGFASQSYLTLNKTLLMLGTDRALYGRVMSIYMMGFSAIPVALLPMGAAVDAFGAPVTVAVAGLTLLAVVLIGSLLQGFVGRGGKMASLVPGGD